MPYSIFIKKILDLFLKKIGPVATGAVAGSLITSTIFLMVSFNLLSQNTVGNTVNETHIDRSITNIDKSITNIDNSIEDINNSITVISDSSTNINGSIDILNQEIERLISEQKTSKNTSSTNTIIREINVIRKEASDINLANLTLNHAATNLNQVNVSIKELFPTHSSFSSPTSWREADKMNTKSAINSVDSNSYTGSGSSNTDSNVTVQSVPEPSDIMGGILGVGFLGLSWCMRRSSTSDKA